MADIDDLKIGDAPTRRPTMRRTSGWWIAVLVAAAVAASAWMLFNRSGGGLKVVETLVLSADSSSKGTGEFSAAGYLEVVPPGPYFVSTKIEGRVVEIKVVPGQTVEEGEELGCLDAQPIRNELSILQARLAQSKERLATAGIEYERNKVLAKTSTVPQKTLDASEGAWREDSAMVHAAEAEVARAQWQLDQCVIRSPHKGTVLEVFVHPGEWVSPSRGLEKPGAFLSLFDPKQIQAWVDVNQRDIGRVTEGQECTLATDADPGRPVTGKVTRILPRANLQKNTVQAKVAIADPPKNFRPEMSVKVTFLAEGREPLEGLRLPQTSVARDGARTWVFVIESGKARRRWVQIEDVIDGKVLVKGGLSPGDNVILTREGLAEGDPVTPSRR